MKSFLKKRLGNEKGIALLLVLGALAVLTIAVIEFCYSQRVTYRLAVNNKERLQAYYLAKSAVNLSRLMLKYSKDAEKLVQNAGANAPADIKMVPLYKQMPLSSELIRGLMTGSSDSGESAPAEGAGEKGEETGAGDLLKTTGLMESEKAKEFLSFDGDFSSEISEEQTRLDLNRFAGMETASPNYDNRKKLLLAILTLPEFKEAFEDPDKDALKLTHALVDWVDANDMVNDFGNVQRGSESEPYSGDYKVKNGKMLSLSEMRLVAGMNDAVFDKLSKWVTVYGGQDKINACLAEDDLMRALITHYVKNSNCVAPFPVENDEKMNELVGEVKSACPDVAAMAAALNGKLGLVDLQAQVATPSSTGAGAQVSGCLFQFKDLLTADNKVFTVRGEGRVGETRVSVRLVVNTDNTDPTKWKTLFYRVE